MLTIADKGGRGIRQMLTITDNEWLVAYTNCKHTSLPLWKINKVDYVYYKTYIESFFARQIEDNFCYKEALTKC